ncbi:MAG: PAS domain S-box protein [Burkholderiales bacterium]|nr:PAS domain S-box protein [Burkholderiales bacterium]
MHKILIRWPIPIAWLVFGVSLLGTTSVWLGMRTSDQRSAQRHFYGETVLISRSFRHLLNDYQQALRAAAIRAGTTQPTQDAWQAYDRSLGLDGSLPGLETLAFAQIGSPGQMVVSAVFPYNGDNARLLDQPLRDAAALPREATPGAMVMLPPTPDTGGATNRPVIRLAMPVYPSGSASLTGSPARQAASGYVYAVIRLDALLAATAPDLLRDIDLTVRDVTALPPATLFDSRQGSRDGLEDQTTSLSRNEKIAVDGRSLLLIYTANGNFDVMEGIGWARSVLIGGVALSLLLLWSLLSLARTRIDVDLTAQRMAANLHQNESRLYGIIQSAMEAVITVDEQQNIVIFNPMAERIFLCSAMEAIGTPLNRFIPERFRNIHERHIENFGKTGVSERQMGPGRPLWGLRANGEEFPVEASISQNRDGQSKLYTVLLRDITDRQQAEQALQDSRNELARLSARIQSIREEEKMHIARELHDDLGQRLTALKMDLSMLDVMLPPDAKTLRERTAAMHELIAATVSEVRRIAADLRPVMLDDLGLTPALEWLANDFSKRYGIQTELRVHDDPADLDENTATALFRIVQEALTNVARHAKASLVTITVSCDAQAWRVRVQDNGRGAGADQLSKPKSFGLIGIRERARMLGGEMHVYSAPGEGFRLDIILPKAAIDAARASSEAPQ